MTEAELKAIEDCAAAATEGPWVPYRYEDGEAASSIQGRCSKRHPHGPAGRDPWRECDGHATEVVTTDSGVYTHNEADIEFIAAARTAVPALAAEVRKFRALLLAVQTYAGCWALAPCWRGKRHPECAETMAALGLTEDDV